MQDNIKKSTLFKQLPLIFVNLCSNTIKITIVGRIVVLFAMFEDLYL